MVHKIIKDEGPKDDFSIDASYEFASFVLKIDKGIRLTHVPQICVISSSECATYPRFFHPCVSVYYLYLYYLYYFVLFIIFLFVLT